MLQLTTAKYAAGLAGVPVMLAMVRAELIWSTVRKGKNNEILETLAPLEAVSP
jgi:hypothetical protein